MNLGSLLRGARPLGHLVWWTGAPSAADGFEDKVRSLLGVPLLEAPGLSAENVWWLAPDFDAQLQGLREELEDLHTIPVRATDDTLAALRSSARRFVEERLATLCAELEALVTQPRLRASLLVRRLDALEALRSHAALHARHLDLVHDRLPERLSTWAGRVDAALCARIVA